MAEMADKWRINMKLKTITLLFPDALSFSCQVALIKNLRCLL